MRVALVGPEIEESLSLRYLAGSLADAGFEYRIIPFNYARDVKRVARQVAAGRPDLVGYSLVAQRRLADFEALTKLLRRNGYVGHVTAGGHFASLRAAEILREVGGMDSILHHDGERRIVELARWIASGEASGKGLPESVDGITWRTRHGDLRHRPPRHVADVDSLPFPVRRRSDRTLGFAKAPIVSSRGCAGDCSFCSIRAWHRQVRGARLRFRSPESVSREMITLHRKQGVRVFVFHDDDFIHPNPGRARERCEEILDRAEDGMGVPFAFVIKCRPDDVREELFRYLKSKGLVRAYVGIETHSDLGIRVLNRKVTKRTNDDALRILGDLEIYSCFNLLLFHPDTTVHELDENLGFLEQQVDHPFDIARTELYAGSALEERMIREGRALGDYRGYDYIIGEPEVERVFRLFSDVLWERHFGGESILQRVQDLGYRLSLMRRFHPKMVSEDLESRVRSLIRDVNRDTVENLRRLCRAARDPEKLSAPGTLEVFGRNLEHEIRARVREQSVRWGALSFEMECRAGMDRLRVPIPSRSFLPRMLWRAASSVPYAALVLGSWSCGDGEVVCDPPPPPVRYSRDIEPDLDQKCAVPDCHDSQTASEGLVLESGSSYDNLVNVSSHQVRRLKRVEPSNPDSSYVVHKLEGTQEGVGGTGERMPKGGEPEEGLTFRIKEWIREGATND